MNTVRRVAGHGSVRAHVHRHAGGGRKGDLSRFIEEAIRACMLPIPRHEWRGWRSPRVQSPRFAMRELASESLVASTFKKPL
ncbi:MAG: ribbon-helix-helix domain-containing protein [Azoarcus sp.]|nr:ribbon-helix-helix domain-containing protein [Azoarcus sp.]